MLMFFFLIGLVGTLAFAAVFFRLTIPSSGTIIADVPSLYMFDSSEHYSREALLTDSNGYPVFIVPIELQDTQNTKSHHFQLMLPYNGSSTYYFFYLPSDKQ